MQIKNSARQPVSLACGDKRVSHQRSDACFHGRMPHQPDACFATPATTKGGAAALVLSPTSERGGSRVGAA
jgi:hypothetical protein